ncbi:hypothetical protein DFP75_103221 [Marinomonas alcarazii]|uniref:Phage abortive infection protein n=1 Tax=Marinomonas alcarazii TaxID=491949 RepID=A0A318V337_9GAMM|nr:hypothetical protein [Marinomonas alcarazii]PYF82393.1 hypothetical protein DFP75_103221 [Marinomonas alcarazii]
MSQTAGDIAKSLVDYAPLIGAIIAGFFTVSGILIANYLNNKSQISLHKLSLQKSRVEVRTNKAELLYLSVSRWHEMAIFSYMNHFEFFKGKVSFDQVIKKGYGDERTKDDLKHMEMIINLYYPDLKIHYDGLMAVRTELSDFMLESSPQKHSIDDFYKNIKKFNGSYRKLIDKLSESVING